MRPPGLGTSRLDCTVPYQAPGSWGSFTPLLSQTCASSGLLLVPASCSCAFRTPGAGAAGRGPGERGELTMRGPQWQPRAVSSVGAGPSAGARARGVSMVRTGLGGVLRGPLGPCSWATCPVLGPRWPQKAGWPWALGPVLTAHGMADARDPWDAVPLLRPGAGTAPLRQRGGEQTPTLGLSSSTRGSGHTSFLHRSLIHPLSQTVAGVQRQEPVRGDK